MTIGACLIVKNEEVMLGNCLDSLEGIDEIYIADTGSKDRTVELAKLYTPHVYTDFIWNDSFCDARNFIKSKAETDWILSIDADEILHDFSKVRDAVLMAEKHNSIAVDCTMVASDDYQKFLYPRLFKNVPEVFWLGNIHNHLSVLGQGISDIRITHGYSPAHDLDPNRAFRILKKDVEKNPAALREQFYLGREYFYKDEYKNAISMLNRYIKRAWYMPEKAEAFLIMAKAYVKLKKVDDARTACAQALIINPHFKEAALYMATLAGLGSGHPVWERNGAQWKKLADIADNTDVLFIRKKYDFIYD